MSELRRVMLAAANPAERLSIRGMISESSAPQFEVEEIERLADALARLQGDAAFDLILLDLALTEGASVQAFERLRQGAPETAIVVLSAVDDEELALQAIHEGAQDFLVKQGLNSRELIRSMRRAIERVRVEVALAHERDLLHAILENIPQGIYFKDTQSRFLRMSRHLAKAFCLEDPSEAVGKTDFDFLAESHARTALEDEQRVIQSGTAIVDKEEQATQANGDTLWVLTTKMPLRNHRGNVIGTFGLSREITVQKQAQQDLARVAGELREKNEVLEEDLKMARDLQHAMLPQRYPHFAGVAKGEESLVQFYHYYASSMAVSGDFFDVLKISDTKAGIFICDVMGHGVRAAMVAAMIRTLVGELHSSWDAPGELLSQLNRTLRGTLGHSLTQMFASAFYVAVDLSEGEMHYANAGHPCPLHLHHARPSAGPDELKGIKPGPALGLFDQPRYQSCTCGLQPHDVVLLFTDGLFEVESPHGQLYDYRRLLKAVGERSTLPTGEMCRGLIDEVQQFSGSKDFEDDVCLVAMEVEHLAAAM